MHFSLLFILIFSTLGAQTYYHSSIGINYPTYNARSFAIGSAHADNSALCLSSMPSNLSMGENQLFSIVYSYLGHSNLERRSIVVKDSFDDYLTEADYVRNINYNQSSAIAIKYNKDIGKIKFSAGFSYLPFKTYNYNYKEEIRGSLPSNDGDIFSRDPFLGNHILESEGSQHLYSIGSSIDLILNKDLKMSIGLSSNIINNTTINESMVVDMLSMDDDISGYFSDIIPYEIEYNLKGDNFFTFGYRLQFHKYAFGLSFEQSGVIKNNLNDFTYEYLESIEIFENSEGVLDTTYNIISYDILYSDNQVIKNYINDYLELKTSDIQKPKKYGLSMAIMNHSKNDISFILSYEKYEYDKSYVLSSNEKYSIGIEHYTLNNTALRFGFEYQTSPFKPYISSTSSFTFGLGYKVKKLIFDIGGSYSQAQYSFPDLYPVIDNLFQDLDSVNESNLILIGSLTYKF